MSDTRGLTPVDGRSTRSRPVLVLPKVQRTIAGTIVANRRLFIRKARWQVRVIERLHKLASRDRWALSAIDLDRYLPLDRDVGRNAKIQ
jgi:hypothetical protein